MPRPRQDGTLTVLELHAQREGQVLEQLLVVGCVVAAPQVAVEGAHALLQVRGHAEVLHVLEDLRKKVRT